MAPRRIRPPTVKAKEPPVPNNATLDPTVIPQPQHPARQVYTPTPTPDDTIPSSMVTALEQLAVASDVESPDVRRLLREMLAKHDEAAHEARRGARPQPEDTMRRGQLHQRTQDVMDALNDVTEDDKEPDQNRTPHQFGHEFIERQKELRRQFQEQHPDVDPECYEGHDSDCAEESDHELYEEWDDETAHVDEARRRAEAFNSQHSPTGYVPLQPQFGTARRTPFEFRKPPVSAEELDEMFAKRLVETGMYVEEGKRVEKRPMPDDGFTSDDEDEEYYKKMEYVSGYHHVYVRPAKRRQDAALEKMYATRVEQELNKIKEDKPKPLTEEKPCWDKTYGGCMTMDN